MRAIDRLTFVIPVFNEGDNIPSLYNEYKDLWISYDAGVLFVNDGSADNTLEEIQLLNSQDERVGYISLSRNFGKEQSLAAGFSIVPDNHTIMVIDGDGQHTAEATEKLLQAYCSQNEYEIIFGVRDSRAYQSMIDRAFSKAFYKVLNSLSENEVNSRHGDFFVASPKVLYEFKKLKDSKLFWKGIYSWVGFKKADVAIDIADRVSGKSKFNFKAKLSLAFNSILWTSFVPLHLITYLGLTIFMFSALFGVYLVLEFLFKGVTTPGYYTLALIQTMLGGIILLSLGVIARYLALVIDNTSTKSPYIIDSNQVLPSTFK